MQSTQFLQAATRVEFLAEELYREMASAFFHAPFLRDTFQRLASEERQHAMRLQLIERNQVRHLWTPATMERMGADLEGMATAIRDRRKELASASAARDPYTLLHRLAVMEERFASFHAEKITGDADPGTRDLFASMARQDAEHGRLINWVRVKLAA